jgi:hypothetical protein
MMATIAEGNENVDISDATQNVDKENEVITLDDSDDDEDDGVIDLTGLDDYISVTKNDVAQAFSHFSYVYSGKKMLVCDLQGVYDQQKKLFRVSEKEKRMSCFKCIKLLFLFTHIHTLYTCSGPTLLFITIIPTMTRTLISAAAMEEPTWARREFRTFSNLISAIHFVI